MSKNLKGSIMLLITSFIWGTAFVAQSDGMNYVEPFTYNAMRTLLGGFVLIPIILIFKAVGKHTGAPPLKYSLKNTVKGGICCGVVLFIASSFQQFGIAYTTTGKAGFITALYIVLVPLLLGMILKKAVPLKMWLFVLIAVVGFWFLCINEDFRISKGDFLVLCCALFFAAHIIVVDHFIEQNTDGMLMSCIQFFTAAVFMLIGMFVFESPNIDSIIDAKIPVLYAGIMSSGVAYTMQILGQRYTAPTIATLLMSLESVFAALSGWLILHEKLSPKELCGCGLVFTAVILAQLVGEDRKKE
ncbi:MAG: DMT family transporter [Ruminococcus sp.]|nr:DMT family transporter [Ruminococcus sp.]